MTDVLRLYDRADFAIDWSSFHTTSEPRRGRPTQMKVTYRGDIKGRIDAELNSCRDEVYVRVCLS